MVTATNEHSEKTIQAYRHSTMGSVLLLHKLISDNESCYLRHENNMYPQSASFSALGAGLEFKIDIIRTFDNKEIDTEEEIIQVTEIFDQNTAVDPEEENKHTHTG